jgi:glycosyltransferase involved in cell wall biosynthesis
MTKITATLNNAVNVNNLEIVVVDAGLNDDDLSSLIKQNKAIASCGGLKIVKHATGGGRGPSLNTGASSATNDILAFLHCDTLLPLGWDLLLLGAFKNSGVNMTSFKFGISRNEPFIKGLWFIELMTNIRSKYFKLPYGDQCLSVSKSYFEYVGGYPEQPLFEDTELVDLMRKRERLFKHITKEAFVILPGEPVVCDDRRWRKLGAIQTMLINSQLVNEYNQGQDPDDMFLKYYGKKIQRYGAGEIVF